jgi:hypothetical protein
MSFKDSIFSVVSLFGMFYLAVQTVIYEQISESETMEAKVNERYDLPDQVGGSEIYFVGCT